VDLSHKKIHRGQRYLQKTKFWAAKRGILIIVKRGQILRQKIQILKKCGPEILRDLRPTFRIGSGTAILTFKKNKGKNGRKKTNFKQTGATAPYPSQIYDIS
jgi:hypothetical protein